VILPSAPARLMVVGSAWRDRRATGMLYGDVIRAVSKSRRAWLLMLCLEDRKRRERDAHLLR
jgi:hypothetical protein